MHEIREYLETELTNELAVPIATLSCLAFEGSVENLDVRVAKIMVTKGSLDLERSSGRRFAIWEGPKVIAHARTFIRDVFVDGKQIPVLALASVCTAPEFRGQGLGARVTRKAFEQIDQPGWPSVSLFQTPVPQFYEKLNCRIITNRCVNLQNTESPDEYPWLDDTVMIYPAEYEWPEGTLDINGPGY